MGKIGKTFTLILTLVIAISCVTSLTAKPVSAQSIPTPAAPTFTAAFVPASYSVTTTDPYTGVSTTTQVDNSTIELTIKNQPFDYPANYHLYYDVQVKPHFGGNWTNLNPTESLFSGSNLTLAQYISTVYSSLSSLPESNSAYTTISYSPTSVGVPFQGGQVDFQVSAVVGVNSTFYSIRNVGGVLVGAGQIEPAVAYVSSSDWGSTKTVTIPASSVSPSPTSTPTPAIPEFSAITLLPLLFSVFFVAIVLRHRKTADMCK